MLKKHSTPDIALKVCPCFPEAELSEDAICHPSMTCRVIAFPGSGNEHGLPCRCLSGITVAPSPAWVGGTGGTEPDPCPDNPRADCARVCPVEAHAKLNGYGGCALPSTNASPYSQAVTGSFAAAVKFSAYCFMVSFPLVSLAASI